MKKQKKACEHLKSKSVSNALLYHNGQTFNDQSQSFEEYEALFEKCNYSFSQFPLVHEIEQQSGIPFIEKRSQQFQQKNLKDMDLEGTLVVQFVLEELSQAIQEITEKENIIKQLVNISKFFGKQCKEATEDNQEKEQKLQEVVKENVVYKMVIEQQSNDLANSVKQFELLDQELQEQIKQNQSLQEEYYEKQQSFQLLVQENKSLKLQVKELHQKVQEVEDVSFQIQNDALQRSYIKEEKVELTKECEKCNECFVQLQDSSELIGSLRKLIQDKDKAIKILQENESQLLSQLRENEDNIDQLTSRIEILQEKESVMIQSHNVSMINPHKVSLKPYDQSDQSPLYSPHGQSNEKLNLEEQIIGEMGNGEIECAFDFCLDSPNALKDRDRCKIFEDQAKSLGSQQKTIESRPSCELHVYNQPLEIINSCADKENIKLPLQSHQPFFYQEEPKERGKPFSPLKQLKSKLQHFSPKKILQNSLISKENKYTRSENVAKTKMQGANQDQVDVVSFNLKELSQEESGERSERERYCSAQSRKSKELNRANQRGNADKEYFMMVCLSHKVKYKNTEKMCMTNSDQLYSKAKDLGVHFYDYQEWVKTELEQQWLQVMFSMKKHQPLLGKKSLTSKLDFSNKGKCHIF